MTASPQYNPQTVLLDHRNQVRFDDPLIGSQEPEPMDASGGNNHAIRRIAQRTAQRGDFLRDVRGEWNDSKGGICVQLMEQGTQAGDLPALGKQCDFEKGDGADSEALSVPDSFIKDTALLPGQFLRVGEPADRNMGVKKESRIQEGESSNPPKRIPKR